MLDLLETTGDTLATGISGTDIVGVYINSSGDVHGFLYNGSAYTTLDDPLAIGNTLVNGIDGDKIVGSYIDSTGHYHGFLYQPLAVTPEPGVLALLASLSTAGIRLLARRRKNT